MRHRTALTLASAVIAVTLAGCGSSQATSEGSAAEPSPVTASEATSQPTGEAVGGSSGAGDTAATRSAASGASAPAVSANGVTVTGAVGTQPKVTVTAGEAAPADLVTVDIYPGTGKALEPGGSGVFDYEGVLFSEGTVFDSSWERGRPLSLSLDRVIPGWQEGLVGMKEGGRRLLIIPPNLAYGNQAIPGIAPNSTLVFVVDLQKVTG